MKKRLKKATANLKVPTAKKTRSALTAPELPAKGLLTHHIAPGEILVVIADQGVYTFKSAHLIKTFKGPQ